MQFIFLLYILKKRLVLLRHAVRKSEKCFKRQMAWTSTVSSLVVNIPVETVSTPEAEKCFKNQRIIADCLGEAFCKIKAFYVPFSVLHMFISILAISVTLLFFIVKKDPLYFAFFFTLTILLSILPVFLYVHVRREINAIQNLITEIYWSNNKQRNACLLYTSRCV